jgi:hypothetical protein
LVDASFRLVAIHVVAYGKNSDGDIFSNFNLDKSLKNNKLQIPPGKQLPASEEKLSYVITEMKQCFRKCLWDLVRKFIRFLKENYVCHKNI